jgi:hypothetical protein
MSRDERRLQSRRWRSAVGTNNVNPSKRFDAFLTGYQSDLSLVVV